MIPGRRGLHAAGAADLQPHARGGRRAGHTANQGAAHALARSISGARTVVLERAGHMISMEEAERFTRLVLDFIAQHPL